MSHNIQNATPIASADIINLADYRKSHSSTPSALVQWKEDLVEELTFVVDEWRNELKIDSKIIELAKVFINNLPYGIKTPSISVENQNAILFEWSKEIEENKVSVFSVILEEDRIIYSTYNLNIGGDESNGVLNMSDLSIEIVSNIILEHFKEEVSYVSRVGYTI